MKKYVFIYIFLSISLIIIPYTSFGILSDPMWLDMYKKIDKWIYDLEVKYLEREMKWDSSDITSDLNKRAKTNNLRDNCFKEWLTIDTIKKVVNDTDISNIITNDCLSEEMSIWSQEYNEYIKIIKESFEENYKKTKNKVKKTYEIWRIWMYSDWLEENSPFDLMVDINEIDKIIFEQDIPYDWVNTENLWNVVNDVLNWMNPNTSFNLNRYKDNIIFQWKYKDIVDNSKTETYNDWNNSYLDNWLCVINNSWLSQDSLNKILWQKNIWNSNNRSINSWNLKSHKWIFDLDWNKNSSVWWYSKVNDNSFWPCNEFFCIVIKFVTYQHKLLWWWKNLSIEWLLKRSNEHLKKFSSTSLIQSNMTINNFQLWLKDLNLPDIFHVWLQVSYKPVPIINVEKDNKDKDSDEFKFKNLLTRYYKNLWLDYERANDLDIFNQNDSRIKNILEWTEMSQTEVVKKENSFYEYLELMKKENEYVSDTIISKKILEEDMDNFYKEFAELESFTNAILDYVIWIWWIIDKMTEIPKKW